MATAELLDFNAARKLRSARMENQKQGHFALFRSLLSKDWASDVAKLALWVRIIGQAQYKPRSVEFDGVAWDLQPGQLVTKISILARKLKDSQGNEKTSKQVRDMLEFFTKEKMITFAGNRHGTVITIINYVDYQGNFEVTNEVGNEVTNKSSNGAASGLVEVTKQVSNEVEQSKKLLEQELKTPPKSPKGESKKFNPQSIPVPEWLNQQVWDEWGQYRQQSKKPISTALTVTKAFSLLKECFDEGYDPAEVINSSIANGYQGLFKPRHPPRRNQPAQQQTPHWNSREGWKDFL